MPVILLERIPLPSLRAYTGFSVILLACAVFYAHQVVQTAQTDGLQITENPNDENDNPQYMNVSLPYDHLIWNMVYVLTAEAWCVWVSICPCASPIISKIVKSLATIQLLLKYHTYVYPV
jgi:autocrine motility factor receptor